MVSWKVETGEGGEVAISMHGCGENVLREMRKGKRKGKRKRKRKRKERQREGGTFSVPMLLLLPLWADKKFRRLPAIDVIMWNHGHSFTVLFFLNSLGNIKLIVCSAMWFEYFYIKVYLSWIVIYLMFFLDDFL